MNRILNVITYVLAAIYFLVDADLRGRGQADLKLDSQSFGAKLRAWIRSLPPLTRIVFGARDHPLSSVATLITGELLKLVLVERLFSSVSSAIS